MLTYPINDVAAAGIAIAVWLAGYMLVFVGIAIGNGFIAAKLNKSVALWVILSLVPLYNIFFLYYVGYVVIARILGRLNDIFVRVEAISS
jgi:hypothetical protein